MGLQRHNLGLAVVCGLPAISAIFVCLRFLARWRRRIRLGWDDWLLCLATLLAFGLIGPSVINFRMFHWGYHVWEYPMTTAQLTNLNFGLLYAINLSFNILSIPILPLSKASIILLLLRIGKVLSPIRRFLYVVFLFNFLAAAIPWALFIFICPSAQGVDSAPNTFGNLRCFDHGEQGKLLLLVNVANLATDVLVFPVPFFIMRELMNTTWRSKVTILLTFASSLGVTVLSALKIPFTEPERITMLHHADKMYSLNYCITHAEANVGIIVACLPTLRGLISPRNLDSTEQSRGWPSSWRSNSHSSGRKGSGSSKGRSRTGRPSVQIPTYGIDIGDEHGGSSTELVIRGKGYSSPNYPMNRVVNQHTFNATPPLPPPDDDDS